MESVAARLTGLSLAPAYILRLSHPTDSRSSWQRGLTIKVTQRCILPASNLMVMTALIKSLGRGGSSPTEQTLMDEETTPSSGPEETQVKFPHPITSVNSAVACIRRSQSGVSLAQCDLIVGLSPPGPHTSVSKPFAHDAVPTWPPG